MLRLDKAFMGLHKTLCCQELEKEVRSNVGRFFTYQFGEHFGSTYKQAATGEKAANSLLATGLFPCDKNIFTPHDILLASEDTDDAPVNHPALVNTSDQPSFSSVYFSPLTSAEALRASDVSPVPYLNLQPNTCGTAKKIPNSPHRKFVGATQIKNIKQAAKSKTSRLVLNALLGRSKRQKRGFAGIQLRLTRHKIRTQT
jgi:hypothetical protein